MIFLICQSNQFTQRDRGRARARVQGTLDRTLPLNRSDIRSVTATFLATRAAASSLANVVHAARTAAMQRSAPAAPDKRRAPSQSAHITW